MGGGDQPKDSKESGDGAAAGSAVKLEVFGEHMKVPTTPSIMTVMAKLTAQGSGGTESPSRVPVTICAVIDKSGSMKENLPLLKDTLQFMIKQLRSKDRLSLITFADEVDIALPLTAMDVEGRIRAEQAVLKVTAGGRTNLSGGLLAGLEALYKVKSSDASLVESVLLFTDGKANVGICDQPTLVKATKSLLGQIERQACVFTFGYGSEHDADLLHAVAEAGNGLFYYIDGSDNIPESFCDCLGGLLSVVAQNVKLTFTTCGAISMKSPKTSYKVTMNESGRCYEVVIPDIYHEEERCILATVVFSADPSLTEPVSVPVVTCSVGFFDVLSHTHQEATAKLNVVKNRALDNPIPSDAQDEIELHRIRCDVATQLEEADALAKVGKIHEAKVLLGDTKVRIERSRVHKRQLAVHLAGTVAESLDGLQDKETYLKHGKAVLKNYSISHWQQRSSCTPSMHGYVNTCLSSDGGAARGHTTSALAARKASLTSPYVSTPKSSLMSQHTSLSSQ